MKSSGFMVQSSDLVRISTVQSMDFMDFIAILRFSRGFISLNPQADLRNSFISLSGCQFDSGNRDCLLHNLSSDKLRFADGVSEINSQNTVRFECRSVAKICIGSHLNFLFYSSSSWDPHVLGVKSSDFLINPWINPQIVWISLNPWIYQIIWGPSIFLNFQFEPLHLILKFTFFLNI